MVKNTAVSVRERLKNLARKRQRPFNELLQYYAMERLLYRLSRSEYANDFVLKGALMMVVWEAPAARPTKDIDLLAYSDNSPASLRQIFREICATEVVDDGIIFDGDNIETTRIKEDADYEGVRLIIRGKLGTARLNVQVDAGFGDIVSPAPDDLSFPSMLDFPSPILRGYPRETVIAEKLNAMVELGMLNSRLKDFYDLWLLSELYEFEFVLLREAVEKTFKQRKTSLESKIPVALTPVFTDDKQKMAQWTAFQRRLGDIFVPEFEEIRERLSGFLGPLLLNTSHRNWQRGGPWL